MSEENKGAASEEVVASEAKGSNEVELQGVFASKLGMTSVYGENGEALPVTVLRWEPWVVTELKTKDKHGYEAVQVASRPQKSKNSDKASSGHFQKAGFESGAKLCFEVRQNLPEGVSVGQKVALSSVKAGDKVKLTGTTKGRGFSGVMKRHGFGGGPASHGSGFHRKPGSIGNCNKPGRVMPGRKLPGQYGNKKHSVPNVQVVEVMADKNLILVKGPVPGARNSLVRLMKV